MTNAQDFTSNLILSDATLRDGNHAVGHKITALQVGEYCKNVDMTGVSWVEVGHGNGLGASCDHIGTSNSTDHEILVAARENLINAKLAVHVMPGIATYGRDILPAIELGVDIFRIASHCTEADTTARHIELITEGGRCAVGVLMMTHMASPGDLIHQAKIMESAGASAVILMDSAGALRTNQVRDRVSALTQELGIGVGFHAHNNLSLSVANSLVAVESGAKIIDACAAGFGAGAGNAPMEVLIPLFAEMGLTNADTRKYFECVDLSVNSFIDSPRTLGTGSIATGLSGLFSGYLLPIKRIAAEFDLSQYELIEELANRKPVAGQEDLIMEVALEINSRETNQSLDL